MLKEGIGQDPIEFERPEGSFFTPDLGLVEASHFQTETLVNGQYVGIGSGVYLAYAVRYESPARKKVKDTKVVLYGPHELEVLEDTPEGLRVHQPFIQGRVRKATRIPVNSQRKTVKVGEVELDMLRKNALHGRKDLNVALRADKPIPVIKPFSFPSLKVLTHELIGDVNGGTVFEV